MEQTTLSSSVEHIFNLNQQLLGLAREGQWDKFIMLAETYVISLHELVDKNYANISGEEIDELKRVWQTLLQSEAEITTQLNSRLNVLKKEMSSLQQGKKCAQAYSSQIISSLH